MSSVILEVLSPDDWAQWRELRLEALSEAPDAFGSTLAEWTGAGDTEERWRRRLSAVPLNLVALLDGEPVDMTSATSPSGGEVELISMWVAPSARGRSVGAALIDEVVRWAAAQGVSTVAVDVRQGNVRALRLYERSGFVDVGPSPNAGADEPERRMLRQPP